MTNIYIPEFWKSERTFAYTEGAVTHTTTTVDTPPQQGLNIFMIIAVAMFGVAGLLLGKGVIDLIYDKYYKGSMMKGLI